MYSLQVECILLYMKESGDGKNHDHGQCLSQTIYLGVRDRVELNKNACTICFMCISFLFLCLGLAIFTMNMQ